MFVHATKSFQTHEGGVAWFPGPPEFSSFTDKCGQFQYINVKCRIRDVVKLRIFFLFHELRNHRRTVTFF